jgi:hypothetical protein
MEETRMADEPARTWRAAFGPQEVIQRIRPEHTDGELLNPHRGTATFQRFNGDPLYPGTAWNDAAGPTEFPPPANADLHNDRYPATRVAYCRWLWSVLEPRKGQFRWDILDRALETAAARRQTLQVRTQPFIAGDVPAWYWETGAAVDEETYRASGRKAPDHNDPLYVKHWCDHIRGLGERYDGHPALESFDIAYGGPCGEGGGNATAQTARLLVGAYLDAFRRTQLVAMLGTAGCAYAATRRDRAIGWRADCYGDLRDEGGGAVPNHLCWNHMHDAYPKEVEACGVKDAWKTAPVTLETCWTVPHWHTRGWDIDFIIGQGYKYHVSVFMPKSVYIPESWRDKIAAFNNRIGYRFHLMQMVLPLEARPGQPVEVQAVMDNRGVAPIYRPYRFALRFSQGERHCVAALAEDIRRWMPDLTYFREKFVFPPALVRGEAKVSCAIIGGDRRPAVRLAIKAVSPDGWHPLTSMDVV